jgi:hypothetical protein
VADARFPLKNWIIVLKEYSANTHLQAVLGSRIISLLVDGNPMTPFRAVILIVIIVAAGATVAAYPAIKGNLVPSTGASTNTTTTTSASSSSTATTLPSQTNGTLYAIIDVGPIEPVCRVNSTTGPAPSYSSIELIITSSGTNQEVPLVWLSNSCDAFTSAHVSLLAGAYTLNLTSCNYMGCSNSLPRGFAIANGQTTTVQVSVDTGIR